MRATTPDTTRLAGGTQHCGGGGCRARWARHPGWHPGFGFAMSMRAWGALLGVHFLARGKRKKKTGENMREGDKRDREREREREGDRARECGKKVISGSKHAKSSVAFMQSHAGRIRGCARSLRAKGTGRTLSWRREDSCFLCSRLRLLLNDEQDCRGGWRPTRKPPVTLASPQVGMMALEGSRAVLGC